MNRKGFILSTYVYILLTFFLLILGTTLVVLNNTKMLAKKIKEESFNKSGIDSNFSLVLNGDKEMKLYQGEEFIDPGYIAQNIKGEALEAVINSNVDINNVGDYIVVYTITYNGETKSVTRKVKVEKFIKNFEYTGDVQEFVVPVTGIYQIELWGAQGGDATTTYIGGKGAYTSGKVFLNKNEKINIYVGEKGDATSTAGALVDSVFNGGGSCATHTSGTVGCGTGGGATDIRIEGTLLNDRIMVAAGGGGAEYWYGSWIAGSGGAGGDLIGNSGTYAGSTTLTGYEVSQGGTQSLGGTKGCIYWGGATSCNYNGYPGSFGAGGNNNYLSGGGGGGYYGGGSAAHGGGAGGSSYISGYTGCVAVTSEGDSKPGCADGTTDNSCSIHYSGKVFTDSTMIAGDTAMPTHDGESTMIGNAGNGYAKITYVGE